MKSVSTLRRRIGWVLLLSILAVGVPTVLFVNRYFDPFREATWRERMTERATARAHGRLVNCWFRGPEHGPVIEVHVCRVTFETGNLHSTDVNKLPRCVTTGWMSLPASEWARFTIVDGYRPDDSSECLYTELDGHVIWKSPSYLADSN